MPGTATATVELVGWRNRRGRWARASAEMRDYQRDAARAIGSHLEREAQKESPRGKGDRRGPRFAERWRAQYDDTERGSSVTLVNDDPKASVVIWPTTAHEIRPKRGTYLRFTVGSEVVFARSVHHPGTKGNDIPGRVLRGSQTVIDREGNRAASRLAEWLAE